MPRFAVRSPVADAALPKVHAALLLTTLAAEEMWSLEATL